MIELNHVSKSINDTLIINNVTTQFLEGKTYGIIDVTNFGTNVTAPNGDNKLVPKSIKKI